MLARALCLQGFAERAYDEVKASFEELRDMDRQLPLCRTLYFGICRVTLMTGDLDIADREIARLIEVSTRSNLPTWMIGAHFLEGKLLIDLSDRTVELAPRQGFVVSKGVMHRTRAEERTVILMVERAGIIPTAN